MAVLSCACRASAADGTAASDFEWYNQTSEQAFTEQGLPPVEVTSTTIEGSTVRSHVDARPGDLGNSINFVLTLPQGEITSAALTVENLSKPAVTSAEEPIFQRVQPVTVKALGYIRGNRIVKFQFPAVVPGTFGRRFQSGILNVNYKEPPQITGNEKPATNADPRSEMTCRLVANPTDVQRFAVALDKTPVPIDKLTGPPLGFYPDGVARFTADSDSFLQFTGADLAACGVDLGHTQSSHVSVWTDGVQQAVIRSNPSGKAVQPGDTFTLYAHDNISTYTKFQEYWIRVLDAPGIEMAPNAAPSAPEIPSANFQTIKVVEQDTPPVLTQNDQFLTILGYRWVWWTWTSSPGPGIPSPRDYASSGSLSFTLPGLVQNTQPAELTLQFYAHHWNTKGAPVPFRVDLNGQTVGKITVSEPAGLEHKISVPVSTLEPIQNTMVITPETTATREMPELCFDRLEVRYPRDYSMTSNTLQFSSPAGTVGAISLQSGIGGEPVLVADITGDVPTIAASAKNDHKKLLVHVNGDAGRKYLAVSGAGIGHAALKKIEKKIDLRLAENRADIVVIAWPDFMEDMQPWVERRRAQGHAVLMVDVFDIYDQFGYGNASPFAIREFLRFATMHWRGSAKGLAASTVLLVGDSTSAYRDEFRNDVINYVPTMRRTDTSDPFASDQWYVSLFGNDPFADCLIGRFSVNTREDLRNLVRKQLNYETAPASGAWQNTLGFIADHSEFEEFLERVMRHAVPPRFFMDRVLMSQLPWIDNYYFPKEIADARQAKVSPEATGRIRDMFNKGAAVVTYFGHGSPNIWSNERMWFGGDSPNSDNLLLTNQDRLAIVINMTCNSGAIDYPQPRWNVCISEDFMRVPNGGAVACFVPSGPGLTVQHERMMMEVGRLLFGVKQAPLGESLQLAMWRYLAAENPPELAEMFILLGDPLLVPHIAGPLHSQQQDEQSTAAVTGPATAGVPSAISDLQTSGSYQLITYNDTVQPGPMQQFAAGSKALPVQSDSGEAQCLAVAVANGDNSSASSSTVSAVVPRPGVAALKFVHWRQLPQSAGQTTAALQFQFHNDTALPVRGASLKINDESGNLLGHSAISDCLPFGDLKLQVELPCHPGFTPLRAILTDAMSKRELVTDIPTAITCLRPDNMRNEIAPAVVDPRTMAVRYHSAGDKILANITCQVYVLAQEPLSNLRMGLQGPDGGVPEQSIVTVPPVSPGQGTRVSLSVELSTGTQEKTYAIRFDPAGFYPEFARFPAQNIKLGTGDFPDLVVQQISPSQASPTDGETIFFKVVIANRGDAQADGVTVKGYQLNGAGKASELTSQVNASQSQVNMAPGTTETILIRWDPFQNAGNNSLRFTASSVFGAPDKNLADNTKDISIRVRTKADIRSVSVGVLKLRPEDIAGKQVRFQAKVRNEGETAAHGLKVSFYSEKQMTPENYLGDVDIDVLNPGETKEAILIYKLRKPGEQDRPFHITSEIMYKGSRQRIPLQ